MRPSIEPRLHPRKGIMTSVLRSPASNLRYPGALLLPSIGFIYAGPSHGFCVPNPKVRVCHVQRISESPQS